MTATASTEPRSRNWGGRRPGAGAPKGNRNAARKTAANDAIDILAGTPLRELNLLLPPAVRELLRLALVAALASAIEETAA
jgi:hypothetical protein